MGDVSQHEHVLVDQRRSLPKGWTNDKQRCRKAGVPKSRQRHRARHALCLEMLRQRGPQLPHAWIAGDDEVLVVIRYKDRDDQQVVQTDDDLSNATAQTPLPEFARVAQAEHRIEECLRRAKSETGLADHEVRNWIGWRHHQTLSLIATWFLVQEARWEKRTPALTPQQVRKGISQILHHECQCDHPSRFTGECEQRLQRNELARLHHSVVPSLSYAVHWTHGVEPSWSKVVMA